MISKEKLTKLIINKCRHKSLPTIIQPNQVSSNWIITDSKLPYLKLNVSIPTNEILNEINNINHLFVEHREQYGEHLGWESFCIHGKSFDSTREDSFYNDNRPYVWTDEANELMPATVNFFKNNWFGNQFRRLRVMKLNPGGYIFMHSDGKPDQLSPVNIAITQPDGCEFVFENYGTVPFRPGSAFALNIFNNHCVFNNSDQVRYHIIAHHLTTTEEYNTMLVQSFNEYINETSTTNN